MAEIRPIPTSGATTQQLQSIFTIWLLDGVTPALSEAGGQPTVSLNNGAPNASGIGQLVQIVANRYYAQLDLSVLAALPGDMLLTEYMNAGIVLPAPGDTFQIIDTVTQSAQPSLPASAFMSYVSVQESDTYFSMQLNRPLWPSTDSKIKLQALIEATQRIDRLNFGGQKSSSTQLLQFPRGNTYTIPTPPGGNQLLFTAIDPFTTVISKDSYIPADIKIACCEVAYKQVDGVDPDAEIERLATESQGFGTTKTIYNRKFIQEHMLAGIPSAKAWSHLRPYLRDPKTVQVSRAS